jgi:hypothetical protein
MPSAGNGGIVGNVVYETFRQDHGWETLRLWTPSGAQAQEVYAGGISADHEFNFILVGPFNQFCCEFGTLYKQTGGDYLGNGTGQFEPTGRGTLGGAPVTELLAQGRYISPEGAHVIFSTGRKGSGDCGLALSLGKPCAEKQLAPGAPPSGTSAIYDRSPTGTAHVVSLRPGDQSFEAGEDAIYRGVSVDASIVAFSVGNTLYARIDNGTAAGKTVLVTSQTSTFAGISANRYVYYVTGGNINRFDTVSESTVQLTTSGDARLVNISADGTHVYFISDQLLDGGHGQLGQPNLYLWTAGVTTFLATVASDDLEGPIALANWTRAVGVEGGPGDETSKTTADGEVLAFESTAKLTTYDADGHTEIYRYDNAAPGLVCVSCNSESTAPPQHNARLQYSQLGSQTIIDNLSADGSRVFFETAEGLLNIDSDEINDIYEWKASQESDAGNLSLITTGETKAYTLFGNEEFDQNAILAITPDGSNVFFRSQEALTDAAGSGGTPAIYDARVDGGFAAETPPTPCAEEGCRPTATPQPQLMNAATSAFSGAGNVSSQPRKRRCHRSKHTGGRHTHRRCSKHQSQRRVHGPSATNSNSMSGLGTSVTYGNQFEGRATAVVQPSTSASDGEAVSLAAAQGRSGGVAGPVTRGAATSACGTYGINSLSGSLTTTAAAQHPDFLTKFALNGSSSGPYCPKLRNVTIELPPGFYGNPMLLERCTEGNFLGGICSPDAQVGITRVIAQFLGDKTSPVFNLVPPHPETEIARFGFLVGSEQFSVYLDISVRTASDYGLTVKIHNAPSQFPVTFSETTFWGDPADPSHDVQRMTAYESGNCEATACLAPGGKRASNLPPMSFLTNPSACQSQELGLALDSYQFPGQTFSASAPLGNITECHDLPFAPSLEARPTTDVAAAPTGLKTKLEFPQSSDPSIPSTATMREARVTLPEGMTANPATADGLAACSDAQVHFHEELDAQCPDASKIGSLEISSPPLAQPLEGAVYLRSPRPGHLLGLWLVTDQLGLHVKIPGEVRPDPDTGRLTAVFTDLPEVPVSRIDLDIWGGARAPLKNPDTCGTYETTSALTPWSSDPPATPSDHFLIDRGSGGGSCPGVPAQEPNNPDFEAGTTPPIAAAYSPFVLKLHREDGSQPFAALNLTLPPGLVGKLAGLSACSEAALVTATNKSGAAEKAGPSCPPASLIGSVNAAAGAGPAPFWTQGKVYLAGPYKGAPLSVAIITPAVAGPFDLGTVVVRSAAEIDPESAQITVKTDPLPQILEGVPLNLRTVAVDVDRPQFMRNGTSCDPLAFNGELVSSLGALLPLSERFQLAECRRLSFKPKIALKLKGSVRRTANPKLIATVTGQPDGAGVARAQVKLPSSAFLDNAHIGTICTRVQFAAHRCPPGSIYGRATVRTPILDYPVSGPVLLRSSSHPLPDLVIDLHGPDSQPIEVALVGRTDSVNGALRNTFEATPDLPFSSLRVELFGGKRGLIEMSSGFCRHPKATVSFTAHNGASYHSRPRVGSSCRANGKHRHRG